MRMLLNLLIVAIFLADDAFGSIRDNTFDYQGNELRVGHTICTPYIYEFEDERNQQKNLVGSDMEMVKYVARALNFNYK